MFEFITEIIEGLSQYAEFYLPILAILIPICFVIWQTQKTKRAEIEFRIYEQRREAHIKLLTMFFDLIGAINDPELMAKAVDNLKEKFPEISKETLTMAAEDVVITYSNLMIAAREGESMQMIKHHLEIKSAIL